MTINNIISDLNSDTALCLAYPKCDTEPSLPPPILKEFANIAPSSILPETALELVTPRVTDVEQDSHKSLAEGGKMETDDDITPADE